MIFQVKLCYPQQPHHFPSCHRYWKFFVYSNEDRPSWNRIDDIQLKDRAIAQAAFRERLRYKPDSKVVRDHGGDQVRGGQLDIWCEVTAKAGKYVLQMFPGSGTWFHGNNRVSV